MPELTTFTTDLGHHGTLRKEHAWAGFIATYDGRYPAHTYTEINKAFMSIQYRNLCWSNNQFGISVLVRITDLLFCQYRCISRVGN